ncbi:protein FRA10AC1 homolog [Centruroides sculpturatus]|uniref:protein FRA10AC1 homolog n=1 Tax=Centruroides sculpturatus TaxID=218467 RepID=UPI000C6CD563|nr:protein FRA10AC1 homolog [Centruroides sculpturatus]
MEPSNSDKINRSLTLRNKILAMDAYSRHKELINHYFLYYSGSTKKLTKHRRSGKTDFDIIRENHQFLWDPDDSADSWDRKLAKKYYDKLFKEYCIADLSRYKENKIALRWRIEKEVIDGKGQFVCGEKTCNEKERLCSWEMNFGYIEFGEKKNALVKLRLCPVCSYKLNYHHQRKEFKNVSRKRNLKETDEEVFNKKKKESETEKEQDSHESTSGTQNLTTDSSVIWKEMPKDTEEKNKDDEFEEYLNEMLL